MLEEQLQQYCYHAIAYIILEIISLDILKKTLILSMNQSQWKSTEQQMISLVPVTSYICKAFNDGLEVKLEIFDGSGLFLNFWYILQACIC